MEVNSHLHIMSLSRECERPTNLYTWTERSSQNDCCPILFYTRIMLYEWKRIVYDMASLVNATLVSAIVILGFRGQIICLNFEVLFELFTDISKNCSVQTACFLDQLGFGLNVFQRAGYLKYLINGILISLFESGYFIYPPLEKKNFSLTNIYVDKCSKKMFFFRHDGNRRIRILTDKLFRDIF